ncbi:MAG: hypothetical protein K2F82_01360 [Muribaculaceae bacterium]|nr:hypothetical protein [Muribaculaceae bacterium]
MARKVRIYDQDQPGLFSPELLGETPMRGAPSPSSAGLADDENPEPSLADQVYQVGDCLL